MKSTLRSLPPSQPANPATVDPPNHRTDPSPIEPRQTVPTKIDHHQRRTEPLVEENVTLG